MSCRYGYNRDAFHLMSVFRPLCVRKVTQTEIKASETFLNSSRAVGEEVAEPRGKVKRKIGLESIRSHKRTKFNPL